MNIQEWSATDISKARSYFLAGLSIKAIAENLSRSTTATNKALSRFDIRPKLLKKRSEKIQFRTKKKDQYSLMAPSFEHRALQEEFDNWVSFWKLCDYLTRENICFYEISASGTSIEHRQFRVDAKILSARQLLMMANKMRTENNLKAFFVRGLSW